MLMCVILIIQLMGLVTDLYKSGPYDPIYVNIIIPYPKQREF